MKEAFQPVFYDIGSRGKIPNYINDIGIEPKVVRFEPGPKPENQKSRNHIISNFALSDNSGESFLYITKNPYQSSMFPPNADLISKLEIEEHIDRFVINKNKVKTKTIDELVKSKEIPPPDWIKCDTQGSEYNIMQGCSKIIGQHLPIIGLETWTQPIYKGTNLISDVLNYFYSKGYFLADVSNAGGARLRTSYRRSKTKYTRAHLASLNILLLPQIELYCDSKLCKESLSRKAIVYSHLGYLDYAKFLCEKFELMEISYIVNKSLKKFISPYFRIRKRISNFTKFKQFPDIT